MATQYLNTEKLQDKKAKLETHKINVLDYLTKIKEEYINLIRHDYWWGNRSDIFFESLKRYWDDGIAEDGSTSTPNGIINNIETDFNNMITFIQNAIDLSLNKDTEAAKDIEKAGEDNSTSKKKENNGAVIPVVSDQPKKTDSGEEKQTTAQTPPENGTSMNIPSGQTSFKSYTNIKKLSYGTPESAIARGGTEVPYGKYKGMVYNTKTDPETGVRYVTFDGSDEKYYCVAMGTYYGQAGDTLKIKTDTGNTFNVILTDVKGSDAASYGNTNLSYYHPKGNNKCVVELYVEYPADSIRVPGGTTGNYNDCPQFSGNITSIEKLN